jgi:hypothetical protein
MLILQSEFRRKRGDEDVPSPSRLTPADCEPTKARATKSTKYNPPFEFATADLCSSLIPSHLEGGWFRGHHSRKTTATLNITAIDEAYGLALAAEQDCGYPLKFRATDGYLIPNDAYVPVVCDSPERESY